MAVFPGGTIPFNTTFLTNTFPEIHGPLGDIRHSVGHAFRYFFHGDDNMQLPQPRANVYETIDKFYIDVELPGIGIGDDFKVKWTHSRTLVVTAETRLRFQLPKPEAAEVLTGDQPKNREPVFHAIVKERPTGTFLRAFEFLVDVSHGSTQVKLQNGLLSIELEKSPEERSKHKEVQVQHVES